MSEADVEPPPTDSPKNSSSTLDNFSREDLVRFIKKQTLVLQKTRSQCEKLQMKLQPEFNWGSLGLKKEVVNYKATKSNNGNSVDKKDFKGLQEQVRMLEEDKEEMKKVYNSLVAEKEATVTQYQDIERQHKEILESYNSLEKELSSLKNKKKELDEQNECLQMKNETLSTSYHFMQEEQEKIVLDNKDLKDQINVLTSARDETVHSLKELQAQCAENESLNSEVEALNKQCETLEVEVQSAESESKASKNAADTAAKKIKEMLIKMDLLENSHVVMVDSLNTKEAAYNTLEEDYQLIKDNLTERNSILEKFQLEKNLLIASIQSMNEVELDSHVELNSHVELDSHVELNSHVELTDISKLLREYKNQIAELKQQNYLTREDIPPIDVEQITVLRKNLSEKEEKLQGIEDNILDYTDQLAELQVTNKNLQHENHSVGEKYENLVMFKVDLENQLEVLKHDFQVVVEELKQSKEAAVNAETLQLELQEKGAEYSSLLEKYTDCAEVVRNLKEKVMMLESSTSKESVDIECSKHSSNSNLPPGANQKVELQSENVNMKSMLEQLLEQKETLVYELHELKEENESQRNLLLSKTELLKEWESLMNMMKDDKERALVDLEETEQRELHWRNELEFLMNSLHEALNERDSLREEMFKLTEKDCSSIDEINRMKKKVEEIINEKCRLEVALVDFEGVLQTTQTEKENLEREKESLTVVMQLSEEHGREMLEESKNLKAFNEKLSSEKEELTKNLTAAQEELEQLKEREKEMTESMENVYSLEESLHKTKEERDIFEKEKLKALNQCKIKEQYIEDVEKNLSEKTCYVQELETKIIELSNSLSSMKRKYDDMKLENEQSEQVLEEAWVEKSETQTRLKEGLLEKQNIIDDLQKTINKMRSAATEEMKMIYSDNDHYRVENSALKNSFQQFEEQLNALTEEKIELANSLEEKHSLNSILEEKLTLACQQREVLMEEKEKLIRTVQESAESLESLSREKQELIVLREKLKLADMNKKNIEDSDSHCKQILEKFEFELQEKDKKVEQLQVEFCSVRDENSNIVKENDSLKKDLEEHVARVDYLTNQLSVLDQLKDSLQLVQTAFEAENEQRKKIESNQEKLLTEKNLMSEDFSEKLEQLKQASNQQISLMQEENNSLKSDFIEKVKSLDELSIDLNEKTELLKISEEENEHLVKLIDEKNLVVEDLKKVLKEKYDCLSELESKQKDVCTFKEQLKLSSEEELVKLRTCLETVEVKTRVDAETIEQLNTQLSTETKEKEFLKEQLSTNLTGEEVHQRKLKEFEIFLNESISKTASLEESLSDFKELLQKKEILITEKSQLITTLENENDSLKQQLNESQHLLVEDTDSVQIIKEDLSNEISKSESLSSEYEEKLSQLNENIVKLSDKVSNYEVEIQTLESSKTEQVSKLESTISALREQVESLSSDIKTVKEEENLKRARDVESMDEKLSTLKVSLKEKDDLNTKLKALAVKSKKQVEELKIQMERLKEEKLAMEKKVKVSYEKLSQFENQTIESGILSTNYACLQQEYDKLHDNWEEEKKKCQNLEKDLQQSMSELTDLKLKHISLKEEKDKINQQMEAMLAENKSLENQMGELNSKANLLEKDKDSQRIQKEEILKEKNEIAAKVYELENQLKTVNAEKSKSLNKLQEQLLSAKIEATQSNMMDLEIADYERTVKSLQVQLSEKEGKIVELNNDIAHLEERLKTLQKEIDYVDEQRIQAEDRSHKLKQLLMKTKKDLADAKRLENEQKSYETQLRGQLEHFTQQIEECKLQLSEVGIENHNLQERLKSMTDAHQRSMRIQEKQVQSLQQQLDDVQTQLNSVQNEYEGYKVRVHSVLKQQKDKLSSNDVHSVEKQEREQQENIIDQLKTKMQELNTNLSVTRQENENLQEEHDRLLMRHNKLLNDFQDRETLFKANLENLSKQNSSKNLELTETIQQLTYQNELLTTQFKDQVKFLKVDHNKTLALLQNQTESNEKEIYRLQKELQQHQQQHQQQQQQMQLQPSVATVQFSSKLPDRDPSDSPSDLTSDILRHEERQQGEGMEFVDTESFHRGNSNPGLPTLVSFEQLLTQPEQDVVKPRVFNEEELKASYDSAQKRSDHLAQLLNESEATVMRLTEQAKILKQEIRRLERNQEREKESANMEYLKNIFLKFVMLKAGDERHMLIPVICTMLKLSPEEKSQLTSIAQGDSSATSSSTTGAWGSYLHRWSGIM